MYSKSKEILAKAREKEIHSSRGYICAECNNSAYYFNTQNSTLHYEKPCLICSESKPEGILVEDFLPALKRHLSDHYKITGECVENTISLKEVLKRFTYDNEDFLEQLVKLLCDPSSEFFKNDGRYKDILTEDFIADCQKQAIQKWEEFAYELKHERRFTHNAATNFYVGLVSLCSRLVEKDKKEFRPALNVLPKGKSLYRGRIARDEVQKKTILEDPNKELSAPPERLATNSRMSPPGISFLYTADNFETAIAELHPFVNDTVAIAEFITTRDLNFFDFTRLDNLTHDMPTLLTNPLKDEIFKDRYFLSTLHNLISRPYRANDTSYIETQVFSEVIRNYRTTEVKYDGIIFGSSQRNGALNYVIFGEVPDSESHTSKKKEYHVEFNRDKGVMMYRITAMHAEATLEDDLLPLVQ